MQAGWIVHQNLLAQCRGLGPIMIQADHAFVGVERGVIQTLHHPSQFRRTLALADSCQYHAKHEPEMNERCHARGKTASGVSRVIQ